MYTSGTQTMREDRRTGVGTRAGGLYVRLLVEAFPGVEVRSRDSAGAEDNTVPDLQTIGRAAQEYLAAKHAARERALPKSRAAIRLCANAIRAAHRDEFETTTQLLTDAGKLLREMAADLREHQDIFFAGFVADAQKEYAEAALTSALIKREPLPAPEELSVEWAPYLNGLGESIGELRRYILDRLRLGKIDQTEALLADMDEIFALLITLDYPDAITGNLRRTTDSARGILEKTRGDLTVGVSQARLNTSLERLQGRLERLVDF
jgi:translin